MITVVFAYCRWVVGAIFSIIASPRSKVAYALLAISSSYLWSQTAAAASDAREAFAACTVPQGSPVSKPSAAQIRKSQQFYDVGVRFALAGAFSNAIHCYDAALAFNPRMAVAYRRRGVAFQNFGNLQAARDDYSRAIEIDPKFADALNSRAVLLQQWGDLDGALSDYGSAIAANPHNPLQLVNRASLLALLQRYDLAAADADALIARFPGLDRGYFVRGHILLVQHRYAEALPDLARAVALNDREPRAFEDRARAELMLGKLDQAQADADRAVALAPTWAYLHALRAQVALWSSDAAKLGDAEKEARAALVQDASNLDAIAALGVALERAHRDVEASPLLDEAIRRNSTFYPIHAARCQLLLRRQQWAEASMDGLVAVTRYDQDTNAHLCLARAMVKLGNNDAALEQYDRVAARLSAPGQQNVQPRFAASIMLERWQIERHLGKVDLAFADLSRALALDPTSYIALENMGVAIAERGDPRGAIEYFNKAIAAHPSANAFADRGYAYGLIGDTESGLRDLGQSITLDPTNYLAFLDRGGLLLKTGDYRAAVADLSRAGELSPTASGWRRQRAAAEIGLRDFEAAAADARAVVQATPADGAAWELLGQADEALQKRQSAHEDYENALKYLPNSTTAHDGAVRTVEQLIDR